MCSVVSSAQLTNCYMYITNSSIDQLVRPIHSVTTDSGLASLHPGVKCVQVTARAELVVVFD